MTTIENKTVLKYRIKHLLDSKEKYERLQIQKNIVSEIQCTYNLLYHLIHLKHGEIGDIKGGQLKIFAKHLGCTVDDLYNNVQEVC
jgi:hypothetical protein